MTPHFILTGLVLCSLISCRIHDRESQVVQAGAAESQRTTVATPNPQAAPQSTRLQAIRRQYIAPLEQELSRIESEKGEDHPDVIPILFKIGKAYREHGAYVAALPVLERALRLSETVDGGDSREAAAALDYLGTLHRLQGNYGKSRDHYERALEITERQYGDDHPAYATQLHNLAKALMAVREMDEAEALLQKSLEIEFAAFGAAAHEATLTQATLGELYLQTGKVGKAEQILIYALTIRSEAMGFVALGAESREDAELYMAPLENLLGALYTAVGLYEKAQPLLDDTLSAYEAKLDASDPRLESVLMNLAAMYEGSGNTAKAETYHAKAERIHAANLGFAYVESMPLRSSVPRLAPVNNPEGPFAAALPGDWVIYESEGEPVLKAEILKVTPVVILLTNRTWDAQDEEWKGSDERMIRRDIKLNEYYELEDLDLQQDTVAFGGKEIGCLTGTIEGPDGTMLKFYLAPDVVPLGGLLRLEQNNEVVLVASQYGRGK